MKKKKEIKNKPSKEEVLGKIEQSSQRMIDALFEAGRHMPEDLPEDQKEQFHRILAMAESLKEKVDRAIKKEKK